MPFLTTEEYRILDELPLHQFTARELERRGVSPTAVVDAAVAGELTKAQHAEVLRWPQDWISGAVGRADRADRHRQAQQFESLLQGLLARLDAILAELKSHRTSSTPNQFKKGR